MVVDLFSGGGGGWCLGARALGLRPVGIEWDGPSCLTRSAAGLRTIRADVAAYPPEVFAGRIEGLCGSPPCQAFSSAGKQRGLADPRGQLVHEPMRWVRVIRPRWVALEQVPEVIGYWRWIARELAGLGYSTWTGILNAADYGVPQVRKRAILLASLDCKAAPPAPTHSRTGSPEMFGPGRLPWVTMAEALGWGWETPSRVVCGQHTQRWAYEGNPTTGRTLDSRQSPKSWAVPRSDGHPSRAITAQAKSWHWSFDRPATTVQGDERIAPPGHHEHTRDGTSVRVTIAELGVLQGFPADHPWQAPERAKQVGNAIPPPLAEACLRSLVA